MSKDSDRFLELDGLRGISILLVLLGHTVPKSFGLPSPLHPLVDAALGVRIFFVISGFIITTLLIQEKTTYQAINWQSFFLRRLTKLFPSLLALIVSLQFVLNNSSSQCSSRSYWVSILFLTEILGVDCWSLGHTWSLSVEELFYLSWLPMVLFLSRSSLIRILFLFVFLSPINRVLQHLKFSHLPMLSHADLLSWGCLAGINFFPSWSPKIANALKRFSSPLVFLSVLVLYFSSLPIHDISTLKWLSYIAVPFRASLQGFLVSILILCFRTNNTIVFRPLFRSRLLVKLGLASYSIYLWQQLIIPNPFSTHWNHFEDFLISLLYLVTAILFGLVAYPLFEKPIMLWLRKLLGLSKEHLDFGCRTRIRT